MTTYSHVATKSLGKFFMYSDVASLFVGSILMFQHSKRISHANAVHNPFLSVNELRWYPGGAHSTNVGHTSFSHENFAGLAERSLSEKKPEGTSTCTCACAAAATLVRYTTLTG